MIKKIYNLLLFNYPVKKFFASFFLSAFVQESGLYKKLLNQRIKKISKKYESRPYCVRIENTNICNARCTMCPRDKMQRQAGVMEMETYKKIVNEASQLGAPYINLHNFGEPLIDSGFAEKVVYAKSKGIASVATNSNGSLLTNEQSKKIINSGLNKLFISIDAGSKESYEKLRLQLDYPVLVKNIKNFMELRRKMGKTIPEVIVNFVVVRENKDEIKQFIENWKDIVDNVSISFSHDWAGEKENIKVDNYCSKPCRLLWTELTVGWNGDYLLCCQDYDGKVILGNVFNQTMKDVWQGEILNRYRSQQLKLDRKGLTLCDKCKLNTFWWF